MSPADPASGLVAARASLAPQRAWLVGGAVRDRLLGRATVDMDLAVAGDAGSAARRLARAVDGPVFRLSESFGAWRVLSPDRSWQADLSPLGGATIEADLSRRDFTINAIAEPLAGGPRVDPFGGIADLQRRRLRMVSAQAFAADPLRVMRVARLACELDLKPDTETLSAARVGAPGLAEVAPERVFGELKRIVAAERALDGLREMDAAGATDVVLPELAALRGVQQSAYHHLDVYDHTLAVLAEVMRLQREPEVVLPDQAAPVAALMAEPLSDELTRGQALRFGALFHDVAKPRTRRVLEGGRVGFPGHDAEGAQTARAVLGRLRASERLRAHVAGLARNHLRLGFLVHQMPLPPRTVYRYLRACEPVEVDVTLLSIADRLATRGRKADEAIAKHLQLGRELLDDALRWRVSGPPAPLLRGDELAAELGIAPGPQIGRLLDELQEARFAGEVATRQQAVRHAQALVARDLRAGA